MRKVEPLPCLALHRDRSAHQLDEALRDGEAEPGTAEPARGRRVHLAERREEPVHPVRRDPDSGVAHRKLEPVGARSARIGLDEDDDLARLGELDRVREQVQQYLAEASLVAEYPGGRVLLDETAELDPLLPRARRDDLQCTLHAFAQR